jgi:targeting protein for Xklp2
VKSSEELELEEMEKAPKFKAKPLCRKVYIIFEVYTFNCIMLWSISLNIISLQILESKGTSGVYNNPKPQATMPKEFHFRTDDRLGPPAVADLFDKVGANQRSAIQ